VIVKAAVLFSLVYGIGTIIVLATGNLRDIPLLQYAALGVPCIIAIVVVAEWYEAGAPWPDNLAAWRSREEASQGTAAEFGPTDTETPESGDGAT